MKGIICIDYPLKELNYAFLNFPAIAKIMKMIMSAATIVAPTGVSARTETRMPASEHPTEITEAQIVTLLKLLKTRIAESAGKMMRAEIRSAPTRFIAITITTAVRIASDRL